MKLSKLDRFILALPFLGVLDVLSTFYAAWRGYPIELYESGLFASYFALSGMLYFYVFIYIGILCGMACLMLFIRREVSTATSFDKFALLLLVATAWILDATLIRAVVNNFLLASNRSVSGGVLSLVVYLSVLWTILTFTWDELKKLFEMNYYEE